MGPIWDGGILEKDSEGESEEEDEIGISWDLDHLEKQSPILER